jgi:hypothetical protein
VIFLWLDILREKKHKKQIFTGEARMEKECSTGVWFSLSPFPTKIHASSFKYLLFISLSSLYQIDLLEIWDKDLLNPNDVIAEASLNLGGFFKKAFKNHDKTSHSIEKQFITLTHPNFPGPQVLIKNKE